MTMGPALRGLCVAGAAVIVLGACSQPSPPPPDASPPANPVIAAATPAASVEAHFNPTEAAGGGSNSARAVTANDLSAGFASIPQFRQLTLAANASPPGATGAEVMSVSVIGQDTGGVLKDMDSAAKQSLGDALLTAAGTAWPNADISLLLSDPASAGGQIIGSRVKGGPNRVIVV